MDRPRLGGRARSPSLRTAVDRRMVADVPVGVPALRRARLQPGRRPAGRGGRARPADLQHRVRVARRASRATSSATPTWSPSASAPTTTASASPATACCPPLGRRHRGDERADGQPRRRRLLPAVAGGGEARQGRAVGPGRRRGLRRLPLVPAAARPGCRRPTAACTPTRRRSSTAPTRPWPRWWPPPTGAPTTPRARSSSSHFGRPGADDADRPGAAHRLRDHARRRPGEAGRQHDDGLGPRGPGAVPRPRARRAGRGLPAGAQAGPGRQGRAQGGRPAA